MRFQGQHFEIQLMQSLECDGILSLSWQSFRLGRLLKLIPFFFFSSLGKKRRAKSDTESASLKSLYVQ